MPPKKTNKQVDKEKKKVIEDKTFGLKNKNKSKSVQKYIQSVEKTVNQKKGGGLTPNAPVKSKKELEKEKAAELNQILKPVVDQPKVPLGVDPKSILCSFFKVGQCTKGAKCKFSHNLEINRKSEKIDIYTDVREQERNTDTIDKWDDSKLAAVVEEKRGDNNKVTSNIVCKYFLEAIEQHKYGWFWECPNNGGACQYMHKLPPGFVLKKKKVDDDPDEEPVPIEEQIEEERKKIKNGTPVTLETFLKWKDEKKKKKEADQKEADAKRAAEIKAGKALLSGREMFVYNPDVFVDDDEAMQEYERQEADDDEDGSENADDGDGGSGQGDDDGSSNQDVEKVTGAIQSNLFVDDDTNIPDDDDDVQ